MANFVPVEIIELRSYIYCGVMKLSADMPSCLGGGDHETKTGYSRFVPTGVDHQALSRS